MENLEVVVDAKNESGRFRKVPKGELLVILADPTTREALWVGGAAADIQESVTDEQRRDRLDYAISKMFKGFPG
jgi:hypothetical protein